MENSLKPVAWMLRAEHKDGAIGIVLYGERQDCAQRATYTLGCDCKQEWTPLYAAPVADAEDAARLDWLDSLSTRTQYQNARVVARPVDSDMHFANGRVSIYIRDLFGNAVQFGQADNIRAAIDAARKGSEEC